MGKHSIVQKKIWKNYLIFICLLVIALIVALLYFENKNFFNKSKVNNANDEKNIEQDINDNYKELENFEGIENEKLVFKSKMDFSKYIEYEFDNNILKKVIIKEQFEDERKYNRKKHNYELLEDINILKSNDNDYTLEFEKMDLGDDEGLNYEQIKEKYITIPGAYEIVE